jgi:hypothetical protein
MTLNDATTAKLHITIGIYKLFLEIAMNSSLEKFLANIEFGEAQHISNMTIIPVFLRSNGHKSYITLSQALKHNYIQITEVNEGGSVPELYLSNFSDKRIIIFEGEELRGAKQNRILNATILVDANAALKIPVSCVESGRWSYKTKHFDEADYIAPVHLRDSLKRSVSSSLMSGNKFESDQSNVWSKIEEVHHNFDTVSNTRAMADSFEFKRPEIEDFLSRIQVLEYQKGVVYAFNGKIKGIDFVSSRRIFKEYSQKLFRGIAMDAIMLRRHDKGNKFDIQMLQELKKMVFESKATVHKSVGLGDDLRFGDSLINGSALIHEKAVVYMSAYFSN